MTALPARLSASADLDAVVLPQVRDVLDGRWQPALSQRRPRIGLVLGAGGVQGNAYLSGAMAAVHAVTGWEPRTAAIIVGTSAGSTHAAIYGAGMPAVFGLWRNRGGRFPSAEEAGPLADVDPTPMPAGLGADVRPTPGLPPDLGEAATLREIFTPARAVPRLGPASVPLAVRTLLRPWAYRPEIVLSAWLPEGILTNTAIGVALRRLVPSGWVPHPRTWITAVNLRTGTREVFGRPEAPRAHLDRAVRASCAIPGVYRAVRIGRDRYVDGGMHSPSNADLVATLDLDLVVVVSPMSSLEGVGATGVVDRYLSGLRRVAGRRLEAELAALHDEHIPTLVLQPSSRDLRVFSRNLMDPRPRRAIAETALETTAAALSQHSVGREVALLRAATAAAAAC